MKNKYVRRNNNLSFLKKSILVLKMISVLIIISTVQLSASVFLKPLDANDSTNELNNQNKKISGKVTDSDGQPIVGATVLIKGTTNGTITNANGEFELNNIKETDEIIVSFIGMISQQIAVSNQNIINVILLDDIAELGEIVVVGYGTVKKSDLSGSVAQVKAEDDYNHW